MAHRRNVPKSGNSKRNHIGACRGMKTVSRFSSMGADLSDYERGHGYDGDYDADIAALQERLSKIQASFISYGNSAVIAVEGWDASGKGGAISRLTSVWDPRWFEV
jgi:polyphosphate kinase 2 (PPK2 family)